MISFYGATAANDILVASFLAILMLPVHVHAESNGERMPLREQFAALEETTRNAFMDYASQQAQHRQLEEEFRQRLRKLNPTDRKKFIGYIADLVVLSFGKPTDGNHDDGVWAAGLVVLSTPRDIVLEAIVPELRAGGRMENILTQGDQDLRKYLERETKISRPTIDEYINYLARHDFDNSKGLVQYLLKRYPERAFIGLVSVFADSLDDRNKLLAHHHEIWAVISRVEIHNSKEAVLLNAQTSAAVEYLSKHKKWWGRLYVGELMHRYPAIRIPEVVTRLSHDEDALVAKAVAFDDK